MGISNSKFQADNPLLLCHKRKYYVKQALDGRCSLASAHIAYIQALKNTGMTLTKLAELEDPVDLSLRTSISTTMGTTGPNADKSISHSSELSSSPFQHVDTIRSFSRTPSPVRSGRDHVNYTESDGNFSMTVEQMPNVSVAVASSPTVQTPPKFDKSPYSDKSSHFDDWHPFQKTQHWDYFDLFHPVDAKSSMQDGRKINHVDPYSDSKKGDKLDINGNPDYVDSEDKFDQPPSEAFVGILKKQGDKLNESAETGNYIAKSIPSLLSVGTSTDDNAVSKDFIPSMKEIEELFLKASESGKEVLMLLEAKKIKSHSLLCKGQGYLSL